MKEIYFLINSRIIWRKCYLLPSISIRRNIRNIIRVSTKWLNLLRKICAIFEQNFFFELLRYFFAWNAMSFARFCAIFLRNLRKTGNIFCESCAWNGILVLGNFFAQFAQNRKFYAICNFLGTLSKIDILSLELNNWRFIPCIKNY